MALLVEDLDGDGERLEAEAKVVANVALIDGAKPALAEDVVRPEALSDCLELEERERDDVSVEDRVSPGRILKCSLAQI